MELKLTPLTEHMRTVCTDFYKDSGATEFAFKPIPIRGTDEAPDAMAVYKYGGFEIGLIFNARMGNLQNVLECRVNLTAGEQFVEFSLYDLMYLLDENDFKCYLFPYIDSKERLKECLTVLFGAICKYRERLGGIAGDEQMCTRAKEHKKKELLRFFKHDIFADAHDRKNDPLLAWKLRSYREWYVSRFCSRWYSDYVGGHYERAAKRLGGYDSKCDYELRMYRFLKTLGSGAAYTAIPPAANTFSRGNALKSARSRSAIIIAAIIGCAVAFAGYTVFGYSAYYIIYSRALYCTALSEPWIPLAALVCSIPTGICASHLLWRKLLTKTERATVDAASGQLKTEKKARSFSFYCATVCSIILMVFAAKTGVAIYDNGIVDNTAPFESHPYLFEDVRGIIYERDTDLYHVTFDGNKVFTCSSNLAKAHVLDRVDAPIAEIDKLKKSREDHDSFSSYS